MPQRPTTHKDLHKAAIGLVFTLVYLFEMQAVAAETPAQAASAGASPKAEQSKLVKKETARASSGAAMPAKTVTLAPVKASVAAPAKIASGKELPANSVTAPVKPLVTSTTQVSVPEVKSPPTKGGRLREIPLSTLNGDKTPAKPEAKADSKAETKTTRNSADKSAVKSVEKNADKKAEANPQKKSSPGKPKRAAVATPRLNNGLVPPPPPVVPIGMDALGMYGQPVDYLSMKELEGRKKELTARFNELDSIVGDGVRQIRERKERAELFESLYQEGVVSRKELETAKREAGDIDRDLKFKQDELESVKISMKAVNNRLAVLKKAEAKANASKRSSGAIKSKSGAKKNSQI